MKSIGKFALAMTYLFYAGLFSGCIGMVLGRNRGYNQYGANQQYPYQQAFLDQGQMNRQGDMYQQGTLNQQEAFNQQEALNQQGSFRQGQILQHTEDNQNSSAPPGYSDSGYRPGYPKINKPSFQGWTDPDTVVWGSDW